MNRNLLSYTESSVDTLSTRRGIEEEIALCEEALSELEEKRYPCATRLMQRQCLKRFIRRRRELLHRLCANDPSVAPVTSSIDGHDASTAPIESQSLQEA